MTSRTVESDACRESAEPKVVAKVWSCIATHLVSDRQDLGFVVDPTSELQTLGVGGSIRNGSGKGCRV